ncbi:MaoC family dehydratase N-terminal domain-containing protein [Solwaraspora sp. WMMD1047]|uniref:FAS1-like dehydratase domain-containing protein n=1 Tax=Solwaraspora sp. WMMD1047 TaxID=3016102 RepID=UPI0024176CBA|nr:MaoC family dehydratase N-terminal domain-containing protein [Solwaraspora sp. WMMD1047]MDG4834311.1 MaoC family dehydratase N-terminal domain-containing protein [Solwaraspora sp. WMMD1047]
MTEVAQIEAPVPPEDISDEVRALIGTMSAWWTAPEPIDRSYLRRFADATFNDEPVHRDERAARAAGYPDVVGPPTAIVRYPHGGLEIRPPNQVFKDMVQVLVYGGRTHVHGGTRLRIFRPLQVGDVVSQRTRLREVAMKQGRKGRMGMIVRETVYVNQFREVLAHTQQIEFELP